MPDVRCSRCGTPQAVIAGRPAARCPQCDQPFGARAQPDFPADPVDDFGPRPSHLKGHSSAPAASASPLPAAPNSPGPVQPAPVQPAPAPTPAGGVPADPHQPLAVGPAIAGGDSEDPADSPPERPSRWGHVALFAAAFGVLTLAGAVAALVWLDRPPAGERPRHAEPPVPPAGVAADDVWEWADASGTSLRIRGMLVEVRRAEFGQVRGRDERGRVVTSDQENFLQVHLALRNQSGGPVAYQSWYGNSFPEAEFAEVATLSDDRGGTYQMMLFTDVRHVQGHTPQAELAPNERLQDAIVYLIPEELVRGSIEYFRLELPAAAHGATGSYRFEIPVSMIEGW